MVKTRKAAAAALVGMMMLAPSVAEAVQPNQLVGSWMTVGMRCDGGPALRFLANGRYITREAEGRWTLRGNRLLLTNWGGGNNVPVQLLRNGRLVVRWSYGTETFRRC